MEEVWRTRDTAEVDALRERIQRLRILEENKRRTAETLRQVHLEQEAEVNEAEASGMQRRRTQLMNEIKRIERSAQRMDVAFNARRHREQH